MFEWEPKLYLKYADQRTQAAIDLANRIIVENPRKVLDIGCGPGNSTHVLAQHFPNTYLLGIDNSPSMIEAAKADYPDYEFMFCDANKDLGMLGDDFDIVFSNACIQWIPNHNQLLKNMMKLLKSGGVLAVQLPNNSGEPIQMILDEVSSRRVWAPKIQLSQTFYNLKPGEYYDLLSEISSSFSIWQTVYFHTMKSHHNIIEWCSSTGLKPYLEPLSKEDRAAFTDDIYTELVKAYPTQKNGDVVLRFQRLFFTATP